MRFIEDYPVKGLEPAAYNPREIDDDASGVLKDSLRKFGIVKPLILNGPAKIAAGHQRLKQLQELGIDRVPVIILEEVNREDEIMFNLFHNSVETGLSPVEVITPQSIPVGYSLIRHNRIRPGENNNVLVVNEILKLVARYGPWGSVIIDNTGRVIHNSDYALACSRLREDLLVYKPIPVHLEGIKAALSGDYGRYYYDHLAIRPQDQFRCQMKRLRPGAKRANRSSVYERLVLPRLSKADRLVDFGAGDCAYVNRLKAQGYQALAYEPHYVGKSGKQIKAAEVVAMIKALEADLAAHGLFDVVVLDGVLNSITSLEFERMVLTACNALSAPDGVLHLGTRSLGFVKKRQIRQASTIDTKRYIQFLDDDNFSATHRDGAWTLQRFHTPGSLRALLLQFFQEVVIIDNHRSDIWASCWRPIKLDPETYRQALDIEFNMELASGKRHGQHKVLVDLLIKLAEARK